MARPAQAEAETQKVSAPRRMPPGVEMRRWWKPAPGASHLVEHDRELPVDEDGNVVGTYHVCPAGECSTYTWTFGEDEAPEPRCCPRHPEELIPTRILPTDDDPLQSATRTARDRWNAFVRKRKATAAEAAQAKADALKQAVSTRVERVHDDYKGHLPLAGVALGTFAGEAIIAATAQPLMVASLGVSIATAGAVAAYIVVYVLERRRLPEDDMAHGRRARRLRERARRGFYAAAAAGLWLTTAAGTGVDIRDPLAALAYLLGALLIWATAHKTWSEISQDRDNQREATRLAAEAAARRAQEEADRLRVEAERPVEPVEVVERQPETPEEMGAAMRAWWEEAANSEFAGQAFPQMKHTWIVPELTRPVIIPIDGVLTRVGWEYRIQSRPGALVTRSTGSGFVAPPIIAARDWLAAMMGKDSELIEMVDRPDRVQNTGAMIVTDKPSVTGVVKHRGRGGIRIDPDGSIWRFLGRPGNGVDVFEPMYLPGQSASGMTIGAPGGGKTVSIIDRIVDLILAGGLPTLLDPKMLVDYAYFAGLFPIGVTLEHRDVIMRTKIAERERRQRLLARQRTEKVKRMKARRSGLVVPPRAGRRDDFFDTTQDGLLFGSFWEEFHMINDDKFVAALGREQRAQRAAAMFDHLISQDGGLGDFKDGSLRGMFQASGLHVFRIPINRARLAGYSGNYDPASMPPLPGLETYDTGGGAVQVIRLPFLDPDEDAEGGVFDTLWPSDGEDLAVSQIPAPMLEVLEREGLMDLWRLGQGDNGVNNLLAGTEPVRDAPTPGQVAGTVGRGQMEAKDVFLAIVGQNPGISRRGAYDHPIWLTHAGWDKQPHPSQISRALRAFRGYAEGEKVGRDKPSLPILIEGNDDALRVTEAGASLAAELYAQLAARTPVPAGPAVSEGAPFELTDAQQAERAAELAREARLEAELSGEA